MRLALVTWAAIIALPATAAAPVLPQSITVVLSFSPKAAKAIAARPTRVSISVSYFGAPTSPRVRQRDPANVADDGSGAILLGNEKDSIARARAGAFTIPIVGLNRARLSWVKRVWAGVGVNPYPSVYAPSALRCDGKEVVLQDLRGAIPLKCKLESEFPPENPDDYAPQGSTPELKY